METFVFTDLKTQEEIGASSQTSCCNPLLSLRWCGVFGRWSPHVLTEPFVDSVKSRGLQGTHGPEKIKQTELSMTKNKKKSVHKAELVLDLHQELSFSQFESEVEVNTSEEGVTRNAARGTGEAATHSCHNPSQRSTQRTRTETHQTRASLWRTCRDSSRSGHISRR